MLGSCQETKVGQLDSRVPKGHLVSRKISTQYKSAENNDFILKGISSLIQHYLIRVRDSGRPEVGHGGCVGLAVGDGHHAQGQFGDQGVHSGGSGVCLEETWTVGDLRLAMGMYWDSWWWWSSCSRTVWF